MEPLRSLFIISSLLVQFIRPQSPSFPEQIDGFCVSRYEANDIRINCKSNQIIAIHEAYFSSSQTNRQCPFLVPKLNHEAKSSNSYFTRLFPSPRPCIDDIRLSMNKKCSGHSNCTFSLKEDHLSKCLEAGNVIVRYICVSESMYHKSCNIKLSSQYGYVSTPGYPEYYPPFNNCSWIIEGKDMQTIHLTVLDLEMRSPDVNLKVKESSGLRYRCLDTFLVLEENNRLIKTCGTNITNLAHVRTKGNQLTIFFDSKNFSPTRGVLFRFSLKGCPLLPPPTKGHLSYTNESIAVYSCCKDHVFEDTSETVRTLYCVHGVQWNSTVNRCIPASEAKIVESTVLDISINSRTSPSTRNEEERNYLSNVFVPIALMAFLLLGNVAIVWILVRLRKKQKIRERNETNIPLNPTSV